MSACFYFENYGSWNFSDLGCQVPVETANDGVVLGLLELHLNRAKGSAHCSHLHCSQAEQTSILSEQCSCQLNGPDSRDEYFFASSVGKNVLIPAKLFAQMYFLKSFSFFMSG